MSSYPRKQTLMRAIAISALGLFKTNSQKFTCRSGAANTSLRCHGGGIDGNPTFSGGLGRRQEKGTVR
jgi:hypothetical protein